MSLLERLIIAAVLAALAVGGWWRLTAFYEGRGYTRAQAEAREVAQVQAERNRDLQRAAEKRYTVQAEARDRFIVSTITEVRHAAQGLAACPIGPAVRLLNDAAQCAREDRPATCGPGEQVPVAREPA